MSQRSIFIYGLIVLAVVLLAIRLWIVNGPEFQRDAPTGQPRALPIGFERVIELRANEPGWKAVGSGPLTIKAEGTIDIGGLQTAPDDNRWAGDARALVRGLPYGMLVAKIGETGEPFRVGKMAQVAMKDVVYLAINDADYSDNSGSYTVTLIGGTKY